MSTSNLVSMLVRHDWGIIKPGQFDVVYIDPPWQYNQRSVHTGDSTFGGGVHGQYDTIPHHEMLYVATQLKKITNENCVMFIWGVNPQMKEMFEFIEAAGFEYKTKGFCWVKLNPKLKNPFTGPGFYTSSNTEDCWIATRGKPPAPDQKLTAQVGLEDISRHSEKPYVFRQRIERMYPDARKLEVFARMTFPDWAAMGNEIDGLDIRDAIQLAQTGYYDLDPYYTTEISGNIYEVEADHSMSPELGGTAA